MAWWREPLLHFAVIGGVLFLLDDGPRQVAVQRAGPGVVVVDDGVIADLTGRQTRSLGRPPTDDELEAAVERWVQTELLVREATRLGLGEGDGIVRERLADLALAVHAVAAEPSEAALRELFEASRERYRYPAEVRVRQVFSPDEDEARALAEAWEAGDDPRTLGVAAPGGPVLRSRRIEGMAETFGEQGASAVFDLEVGERTVVSSAQGWHVVELEAKTPARELTLEEARTRVAVQWAQEARGRAIESAVEELKDRYGVVGWP